MVTSVEAVDAHYATLDVCSGIANHSFLTQHYEQATDLVPGEFYTNSSRKHYRCVKVNGDKANIMAFDQLLGHSLEIEFVQDRKFWCQYFRIQNKELIQQLEERYQTLSSAKAPNASGDAAA